MTEPWTRFQKQTQSKKPWEQYQKPEETSVVSDIAQSAGAGLLQGAANAVGFVGDIRDAVIDPIAKIPGHLIGHDFEASQQKIDDNPSFLQSMRESIQVPNSQDAVDGIESVTGDLYEPKTRAGKYARTIGEFLPAAATGGVSGAVRYGVAPAIASESAGQATEGTVFEPFARVAGAIAGGVGAGMAGKSKDVKKISQKIPTSETIKDHANMAYDYAKKTKALIKPESFSRALNKIDFKLRGEGFIPENYPKLNASLKAFRKRENQPIDLKDIDQLRRTLKSARVDGAPDERRLAGIVTDKIDDFLDNLNPSDHMLGDTKSGVKAFKAGRKIWSTVKKSEQIDEILEASKGYASGQENGIRLKFQSIIKNPKKRKSYSPDEQQIINSIATGKGLENIIQKAGRVSPTNSVFGASIVAGAADSVMGGLASGAVLGGATAARGAAKSNTLKKLEMLDATIRNGGVNPFKKALTQGGSAKLLSSSTALQQSNR